MAKPEAIGDKNNKLDAMKNLKSLCFQEHIQKVKREHKMGKIFRSNVSED
jgi:hypothetical protein